MATWVFLAAMEFFVLREASPRAQAVLPRTDQDVHPARYRRRLAARSVLVRALLLSACEPGLG